MKSILVVSLFVFQFSSVVYSDTRGQPCSKQRHVGHPHTFGKGLKGNPNQKKRDPFPARTRTKYTPRASVPDNIYLFVSKPPVSERIASAAGKVEKACHDVLMKLVTRTIDIYHVRGLFPKKNMLM